MFEILISIQKGESDEENYQGTENEFQLCLFQQGFFHEGRFDVFMSEH